MSISYLKSYNNRLIRSNDDILIDTYFATVVDNSGQSIDVAFMKLYLTLINHEDEFFIDGSMLYKYGVIASDTVSDIQQLLQSLDASEGLDYTIDYDISFNEDTTMIANKNYILTPKIFKIMLITSVSKDNKPNPYVEYIYLLKRIECYYYKYQIALKEICIKKRTEIIDRLGKDNKKIKKELFDVEAEFRDFKRSLVNKINAINLNQPSNITDIKLSSTAPIDPLLSSTNS